MRVGIGREAMVCGTGAARGRCLMLPHLLVVGAGNCEDPDPVGSGRMPSGQHSGDGGCQIGEEIGRPLLSPVSLDTNPA